MTCSSYSKRAVCSARFVEALACAVFKVLGWLPRAELPPKDQVRSVLLVEPFQMGDVLSLAVLFDPLLATWPNAKISVLSQEKNGALFLHDKRVCRTVTLPVPWARPSKRGSLREWWALWKTCMAVRGEGGFDVGIDTRGEIRSQLLMAMCGCRRRAGYTNYMGTNMRIRGLMLTDNAGDVPIMHRYDMNRWVVSRTFHVEMPPLIFPVFRPDAIPALVVEPDKKQIVVHPGAGWEFRRWSEKRWVETLDALGTRDDVCIVLVGSQEERGLVEGISRQMKVRHQMKITSLTDLIGLLKGSNLFIGLDSGPMNLAVVLGVRVLALFGPGNSDLWRPHASNNFFFHPGKSFPCNPCLQKECVFPEANCMTKIGSTEVIEQALKMV